MNDLAQVWDPYTLSEDGIFRPPLPVEHDDAAYDVAGFEMLEAMQARHFWYRGRHRFLVRALADAMRAGNWPEPPRTIDIGCGCGGWISYLLAAGILPNADWAVADSSLVALRHARRNLPDRVKLYQVNLLDLQWKNRWDIGFLLDVLEHVPDDVAALRQLGRPWRPADTDGDRSGAELLLDVER